MKNVNRVKMHFELAWSILEASTVRRLYLYMMYVAITYHIQHFDHHISV